MIKNLNNIIKNLIKDRPELFYIKNAEKVIGANPNLRGDCTYLRGDCSNLLII